MKSLTIYLSDGNNVVDWMRMTTESKLNKRYKLTHLAEDMKVKYSMLYRFVNKKPVSQEFFVAWFRYFSE